MKKKKTKEWGSYLYWYSLWKRETSEKKRVHLLQVGGGFHWSVQRERAHYLVLHQADERQGNQEAYDYSRKKIKTSSVAAQTRTSTRSRWRIRRKRREWKGWMREKTLDWPPLVTSEKTVLNYLAQVPWSSLEPSGK